MAKPLVVVYPKLRSVMALYGHATEEIAEVLDLSFDSTRRRLRGIVEFELSEIIKLLEFYKCSFEDLFGEIAA